jgi:hypothetical protein
MKHMFSIAFIATALAGTGAAAAELPTYERTGFPITPHQFQVLGSAHVEEQSPTPMLMLSGMPASPHQVAVLRPRAKMNNKAAAANAFSTRPLAR